jgi:hypothetical protein
LPFIHMDTRLLYSALTLMLSVCPPRRVRIRWRWRTVSCQGRHQCLISAQVLGQGRVTRPKESWRRYPLVHSCARPSSVALCSVYGHGLSHAWPCGCGERVFSGHDRDQ